MINQPQSANLSDGGTPRGSDRGPVVIKPAPVPQYRQVRLLIFVVLFSWLSYFLISHFIFMTVQIQGNSMSPTLLDGDRYLLFRCPYLWRAPRQGEIVVIRDPEDQGLSIKRIVARPNDLVEIRADGVYVNGTRLAEPYLASFAALATGDFHVKPTRLGPDDYFVLGDNRPRSADSRTYGPVPRKAILGLIAKSG
jgi:signal peptidase I